MQEEHLPTDTTSDSPEQNPFESPEKVSPLKPIPKPTVPALVGITLIVAASSAIAFCCTCFPVALFTYDSIGGWYNYRAFQNFLLAVPWIIGVIIAFLVGKRVRRSLWKRWAKP